jgi:predicted TIM-barrel fold metal-dependent hydrolase
MKRDSLPCDNNPAVFGASRRDLLKTLLVAGAGAALPFGASLAQTSATRAKAGPIDVHHHMQPPAYVKAMEKELAASGFNARPWTPAVSLEMMDKHGVATAMLSPVQRVVADSMSDRSERARTLVRLNNEEGAKVVRDHPGRFGLFAALPLPDTEGSLREIAYAYDTLKADGIALWTSYLDKWPGDQAFAPVFEELNRRKAVVFFHPATASCCRNLIPGLAISGMIEYDLDTARAAESLLVGGTPARFPDVRFIFSHSGGALPTLAARMIDDYPKNRANLLPNGVEYEIKKFYYEVAHASKVPALDALKDIAPISQILFGSDVPIRNYELTTEGLERYGGFSPADWDAIYRGNAERLFPRLKM